MESAFGEKGAYALFFECLGLEGVAGSIHVWHTPMCDRRVEIHGGS